MPNYMKGPAPIRVPLHKVIDVLKTIHALGHTDTFQKPAEDAGATVNIHAKTVNFIKDYMANNNLHAGNEIASGIVDSGGGNQSGPNGCQYHQPGG
jgi:hypothetical protein